MRVFNKSLRLSQSLRPSTSAVFLSGYLIVRIFILAYTELFTQERGTQKNTVEHPHRTLTMNTQANEITQYLLAAHVF